MKKQIMLYALILLLISLLVESCSEEESLKVECVMQINDVGLREGVFERRYKMTSDYGSHENLNPEILKSFIKTVMEPNYLLIRHAYDLGMNKENDVQQKVEDYSIGLIALNHPSQFENMVIPNEELLEFYEKKKVKYDIDIVLANSFSMADTVYKYLKAGNKMEPPTNRAEESMSFPKFLEYKDITYGEILHLDLFPHLLKMKTGQISEPIFTAPIWAIITLNKKSKNNDLKPLEEIKEQLVFENQAVFKNKRNKQLLAELKEKYQVGVRKEYYQDMISAYTLLETYNKIDPEKIEQSDLTNAFLTIWDKEISLSRFIALFNLAFYSNKLPFLTEKDLSHFADNYINQYVLYLDALEKGADNDVLVKDKLVNKEYRTLYTKYLKEEIVQKVTVTDADAKQYYDNNRDKWTVEYKVIEKRVKFELRDKRQHEKKDAVGNKLRKKYNVRYNEALLKKMADRLTEEKKVKI